MCHISIEKFCFNNFGWLAYSIFKQYNLRFTIFGNHSSSFSRQHNFNVICNSGHSWMLTVLSIVPDWYGVHLNSEQSQYVWLGCCAVLQDYCSWHKVLTWLTTFFFFRILRIFLCWFQSYLSEQTHLIILDNSRTKWIQAPAIHSIKSWHSLSFTTVWLGLLVISLQMNLQAFVRESPSYCSVFINL